MTAAIDLANQGFNVSLIEKQQELGGNLRHVFTTLSGESTVPKLANIMEQVGKHPKIRTYLNATIKECRRICGNFKTEIQGIDAVIEHGAVIVASGAEQNEPGEYCYGQDKRSSRTRFGQASQCGRDDKQEPLAGMKSIVMIQCVGSRDEKHGYCSRVCCSNALKNAIKIKELNPKISVYVLFRDIRSYGLREKYYRLAREREWLSSGTTWIKA